jgi:hypothetical protein
MSYLNSGNKVSRIYSNFRGADFRGDEINLIRSPDCLNVWKNYKNTERIETRPGMKAHGRPLPKVNGIFFYGDQMLVHSTTALYKVSGNEITQLYTGLNNVRSSSFVYDNVFYFKDGLNYLKYDGETIGDVVGYIPTTTIARKPMGGGTPYEDVNMLSPYRKNSFLTTGADFDFYLDVMNIDTDYVPVVTLNDQTVPTSAYEVNYEEGMISFKFNAPDAPLTDGQDNLVIQFKKAVPKYVDAIGKCTLLQVFDNRVFFSGNPDFPNMVWNTSLNDPSYVSDLDYYKEGMDDAAVKGLVAGNNALWVFREPSDANTTVFYHTPSLDDEYGKVYPSTHSSITTGCVGAAVNFNDDIVFFSERGMEGISGDVTTEQAVAHRSSLVDRKLTAEAAYKDMLFAEWEGYLLVFVGNKVYLADSRAMFQNENHLEYEWFYWELEFEVTCATVKDGILYLGTGIGVYTLTDTEANVESYWVTALDKFKNPSKLKTTNKRGCVGEATGDISVYAKLEDTDFELIGEYKNITDYFVSRIKRKKFKDLQLKFYSQTRFSLETVTLEVFVGGYIKR